ncbi:MAG TPA: glycine cleavage system aminomethyltransferase GcvT [Acidimicrobiia bacterium]|nr:glycine cleavage system aminomethyltransferase GcvT [Acidimicrobiia bacterium]
MALRHSPLDAEHRALGARMAEFGGWEMPLQYAGVLEEHHACRDRAVVFDVSHLGSLHVHGEGAFATLEWALTNDLDRVEPGRAQYTHLLDVDDGHVVDDLIVWWLAPGEFLVMPNASNTGPLVAALRDASRSHHGGGECTVDDVTADRAVLAVQGPSARELTAPVVPDASRVGRFRVASVPYPGAASGWAAGTGYTGEDGFELHVPREAAAEVWHALLAAGITPAGLGARDTLRLEAGLPLHGHELGPGITPLQAGLGWVVRFDKGEFRGRAALEAERARGVARRLRGLLVGGRQIPRAGCPVLRGDEAIGVVTSGNFSPTLERGIALAFVPPDVAPGDELTIDIRGRRAPATVAELPFVRR